MFAFLLFAPYWQMLLTFLPVAIFAWLHTQPAYHPLCVLVLLPLLSFDIQVLDNEDWHFNGLWRYVSWLLGLALVAIIFIRFSPSGHSSFNGKTVWQYICVTLFGTLMSKMWLGDPLLLFVNRLKTNGSHETNYKVATIKTQQKGRGFSYYIICTNKLKIEVSGFVYLYLLAKGLRKGGIITFNFKMGWLGVNFASGFPKVSPLF